MGASPEAERGFYELSCSATPLDIADSPVVTGAAH